MTSTPRERAADLDLEALARMQRDLADIARHHDYADWPDRVDRLIANTSAISDGELNGVAHVACLMFHHGEALRRTSPHLASLFRRTGNALLTYWAARIGAAERLADLEVAGWDWGEVDG